MPWEFHNCHYTIKGADTAVLPNCIDGPVEETDKIIEQFAKEGLRTLVYAYKSITLDELNLFSKKLEVAKQSIVNRYDLILFF